MREQEPSAHSIHHTQYVWNVPRDEPTSQPNRAISNQGTIQGTVKQIHLMTDSRSLRSEAPRLPASYTNPCCRKRSSL